jgi:hypothetical protein
MYVQKLPISRDEVSFRTKVNYSQEKGPTKLISLFFANSETAGIVELYQTIRVSTVLDCKVYLQTRNEREYILDGRLV